MSNLFEPLRLRGVTLPNRIAMSPMCTYSAGPDGRPGAWHLVHLGARACGGAGLILAEATAVEPRGRISPRDCGLWEDAQIDAWRPIVDFLRGQGTVPGLQLAHAGRKASTRPTPDGRGPLAEEDGGWPTVAPSAEPFAPGYPAPRALEAAELPELAARWVDAARRATEAGFEALELHLAHGYLLHEFLSPLANRREDEYGGELENRARFPLEVVRRVRAAWPEDRPLLVRISATDWMPGGWDLEQAVRFCRWLRAEGVDLVDCSSGGIVPLSAIPAEPGYQVPFAERVRQDAGVPTGAVGRITEPAFAEQVLRDGRADLVLLGREFLRQPYWGLRAAEALGAAPRWPRPYAWTVG